MSQLYCQYLHGYSISVRINFKGGLDDKNWVYDFGDLKDVKKWLENEWDHRLLLAHDDPLLEDFKQLHEKGGVNLNVMSKGYGPGIEDSCKYVYDKVNPMIKEKTQGRAWVENVRIYEHEKNWADYGV